MKVNDQSRKARLKLNIKKKKKDRGIRPLYFMANIMVIGGSSDRFSLLGLKITADADSSHEIRRQLLLGRKAVTNVDCVLKSKDITLPTKVHIVKAMVFTVVT